MTTIKAFFPQIRALFSNFRKRAGETSPPPPSSYAPGLSYDIEKFTQKFFGRELYIYIVQRDPANKNAEFP